MNEKFNVNTILLAVVLGLSGWSLLEQNAQGKAQAAYAVRSEAQAVELAELRIRQQRTEVAVTELQLQIARLR